MRWNPYNVKVTDEWVKDYSRRLNITSQQAKISLHVGLFITNVLYFFRK